jgi:hypothetical protein
MRKGVVPASVWVVATMSLALAGCAAGGARFTAETPAGFWLGLWHGVISVVTLVIGIFDDTVRVYEKLNTGGWYDFGFLLGVVCIWGGGGSAGFKARCRSQAKREDRDWDELGRKVEAKLKRKIREWSEAEPNEDWDVVEKKAEDKLKRKIREWAEEE